MTLLEIMQRLVEVMKTQDASLPTNVDHIKVSQSSTGFRTLNIVTEEGKAAGDHMDFIEEVRVEVDSIRSAIETRMAHYE